MKAIIFKSTEFNFDAETPMTRIYCSVSEHKEVDGFTTEIVRAYAIRFVGHVADKLPTGQAINIEPTDEYEVRPMKETTGGILRAEFKGLVKAEK